ncbi:MAG: putative DNA-directed DNA polymerase [Prokaryotic dsDNA virus sp.]|nr:MAG: putative DNA-directed DNA polymerase [Prokaryotic dsDNA virus sp.]|tara:strand:- start:40143 stop:40877 length:735 start_codon:yes stop_codon:yes gene_type:complete
MTNKRIDSVAKILVIDIEWQPALAYVWQMWKQNIQPDMLVDHGGMLCFCAHWAGTNEYQFYSKWDDGQKGMAEAALNLLEQADAVVTYNGDKYDLPKITGEIVLAGLTPPPPVTSIDLIKTVKKFGFNMNRMAYIAPRLGIGEKLKHEGFNLWKSVMDGDKKAQERMKKYCIQDVRITAKMYSKIKPFVKNHPHLDASTICRCPACNSPRNQKRGFTTTRFYRVQRNKCSNCGHWFQTTRSRIK